MPGDWWFDGGGDGGGGAEGESRISKWEHLALEKQLDALPLGISTYQTYGKDVVHSGMVHSFRQI